MRRRSYDVVMSEWAWDPDSYLAEMAAEVPGYDELQEAVVAATGGIRATRVLELGTGTGETALRVRALHPEAGDVGVPPAGAEGPIYIDWEMDKPDSVEDQLAWLGEAGFEAEASSVRVDLAVFRCRLSGR